MTPLIYPLSRLPSHSICLPKMALPSRLIESHRIVDLPLSEDFYLTPEKDEHRYAGSRWHHLPDMKHTVWNNAYSDRYQVCSEFTGIANNIECLLCLPNLRLVRTLLSESLITSKGAGIRRVLVSSQPMIRSFAPM